MEIDHIALAPELESVGAEARLLEELGYGRFWSAESKHEPFLALAAAAVATRTLGLGTAIAVAFPRSPMVTAMASWDLQRASGGRFTLGLGTQVKGHLVRRFSVGFDVDRPVARLRELVAALRHIWGAFQGEHALRFAGEFYRFSLLTPVFNPGPIEHPRIPVYLGAVRPRAYRLAGEIADGVHVHPFHTAHYLRETALPALERGLAAGGRARRDVTVVAPAFAVTAADPESEGFARSQIAFYGSTPAYAPVFEAHGWGSLSERLRRLVARGRLDEMAQAIDDDVLDAFAVYGETWEDVGTGLRERYAGLVDRAALYVPALPEGGDARRFLAACEVD